jgi:hypothetical protein
MTRQSMISVRAGLRRCTIRAYILAIGLVACGPPPAAPPNPNVACFRQYTGVPSSSVPPTIDGKLSGDMGWTNAFSYASSNGSAVPDMVMMGIRDDAGSSLYLSFLVNNDASFDDEDAIVVTFRPGPDFTVASNDRRIIIYPLFAGIGAGAEVAPGMGAAPHSVSYWLNSGNNTTWNNGGAPSPTPTWLALPTSPNVRVGSYSTAATVNTWWVEMRIPIVGTAGDAGGINLPAGTNFRMSWDVIRFNGLNSTAQEFPWPSTAGLAGGDPTLPIETSTADVANWGNGNRTDSNICNGVSFDWYDIAVVHPAGSMLAGNQIALNQPNDFTVTPHNDAVDAGGNYITSPQINATFQLANWGIMGTTNWQPVVIPGPPVITHTPAVDIPAAVGITQGSATLTLAGWSVPANLVAQYQATPHQCVRVELSHSGTGTVTFKNVTSWTNMDFKQAGSPYTDTATVMTRGYPIGRDRDSIDVLLSAFTYNVPPEMKWQTGITGAREIAPGQFLLRGSTKRDAQISTSVLPPSIKIPSVDLHLPPGAGSEQLAARIPVKPGSLITLLARGSIRIRRDTAHFRATLAGADGVDLGEAAASGQYKLPREQRPWTHVGALVASWDGFQQSAFLVGSARTFKAPNGAEGLTLALNDTPEGLKQHTGEGFAVQVIQTPVAPYLAMHNPLITRDLNYDRGIVPLGSNLPTWILCGGVRTGKRVRAESGKAADLVTGAGCYGSMVNRIGP